MTTNPATPQLVVGSRNQRLVLNSSDILTSGGEGTIYLPGAYPNIAAKIYHRAGRDIESKLTLMINNPPRVPLEEDANISIAWPADILADPGPNRYVLGFVMKRVSGRPAIEYYSPRKRRENSPHFTYEHLLVAARNLARAVEVCHGQRYVIGDINESNVLITDSASVALIDTDSFQVIDRRNGNVYRSPVGKPEFTPAELQGRQFNSLDRTQDHDLFGLAVLIHHLLMEGAHPFTGKYLGQGDPPPVERRISEGHFPHSRRRRVPYTQSPIVPPWSNLHPSLRALFLQCFDNGHSAPTTRPTAHEWAQAIENALRSLAICRRNSQHWYFDSLPNCPWCVRVRQTNGKLDSFPPVSSGGRPIRPGFRPTGSPARTSRQQRSSRPAAASDHVQGKPAQPKPKPRVQDMTAHFDSIFGLQREEPRKLNPNLDNILFVAAMEGNAKMAKQLMRSGANPYTRFVFEKRWPFPDTVYNSIEAATARSHTKVVARIVEVINEGIYDYGLAGM